MPHVWPNALSLHLSKAGGISMLSPIKNRFSKLSCGLLLVGCGVLGACHSKEEKAAFQSTRVVMRALTEDAQNRFVRDIYKIDAVAFNDGHVVILYQMPYHETTWEKDLFFYVAKNGEVKSVNELSSTALREGSESVSEVFLDLLAEHPRFVGIVPRQEDEQ